MATSIKSSPIVLLITTCLVLLLHSCEMKEETKLHPEIVITNPGNNTKIIKGSTIKITGQLKHFSQYYKIHRITLTAGDSTLMKKEEYVPHFTCLLQTGHLTDKLQISAQVRYTNEKPEDKNWNYFSVRDQYEKYVKEDTNKNDTDTLQANASITIKLTGNPETSINMDLVSFSPDTTIVENYTLIVDSMQMGKYEVTNQQYSKFMNLIQADSAGFYGNIRYIYLTNSTGIIHNGEGFVPREGMDSIPVVNVTWWGANSFCQWMGGRLPTDNEWYYASKPNYPYGGEISSPDQVAWYRKNSEGAPHEVGQKIPNKYGMYDMNGNVAEWCLDWYNESSKISRGTHWQSKEIDPADPRRAYLPPNDAGNYLGFRVVIPQ
ncbi:MAG: formylglycine-generating enzyme family protein [Bacteroidales bacterium]|nr:formylglycine-generating enzyme family protein [Bacteroidales bacterium]